MKPQWGAHKDSLKNADSQRKSSWLLQEPDSTVWEYERGIYVLTFYKRKTFIDEDGPSFE